MKWIHLCFLIAFVSCKEQETKAQSANEDSLLVTSELSKDLKVYDYDGLEPLLNKADGKVHVVNFWATWCAPCVKELPYFEAIHETYSDYDIEVLLVSLDFPSKYESKLLPFIEKYQLKSRVVALDDTDQNRWIPAINEQWSGAIPATLIYKGDVRQFYEQSFTEDELNSEIEQFLN